MLADRIVAICYAIDCDATVNAANGTGTDPIEDVAVHAAAAGYAPTAAAATTAKFM